MVPEDAVTVTGEVTVYERPADSGNIVGRAFCPTCGAPVYSKNSTASGAIFLRASSLDDPEVFKPTLAVYTSRGPSWDHLDENLESHPLMPGVVGDIIEGA